MRLKSYLIYAAAFIASVWLFAFGAHAQQAAKVLSACNTATYVAGTTNYVTLDTTGGACGANGSAPFQTAVASTPTIQNASYSSGNCLGGFNAVSVAQINGQTGFVTNVRISSIAGATTGITVYLFNANPSASTCTDKSTFTLNAADVDKLIAVPFTLTPATSTGATPTMASQTNMGLPFIAGGATNSSVKTVYYALVAGGTFTPASTTDIHVLIGAAF